MAPHASPSVVPPDSRPTKRPRLSKSTHRVLNVWAQLAERYNKRLDEDDIVDLYSGTIISDRGVLKNGKDYDFGHFTPDDSQDDQDQEQEQEPGEQDQDDDVDELDTLPVRRAPGTDGTMASTSELLRTVPPLSATTDADDLNDFLEAEKRRRELLGDEDGEDNMSMEQLAALREALRESEEDEEQLETVDPEHAAVIEDESEDELNSIWQHDEASVVYHITRNESEQDVAEATPASWKAKAKIFPIFITSNITAILSTTHTFPIFAATNAFLPPSTTKIFAIFFAAKSFAIISTAKIFATFFTAETFTILSATKILSIFFVSLSIF
jgi:hypothetical protein